MSDKSVRILRCNAEALERSKDEEYAYWQSRPPLERLLAMQDLSFALFDAPASQAEIRQRFLRNPRCLPVPWR
jgi:hypothetical protein